MRLYRTLVMGIVSMSIMGTANAAVYGTLKNDVEVNSFKNEQATGILSLFANAVSDDTPQVLQKGELVRIVDQQDKAYIVALDNGTKEPISTEDVKVTGKLTYTAAEGTKLREKASPNADIISYLDDEELVVVLERKDDFYKVKIDDHEGYIYKAQVEEGGLSSLPYSKTTDSEKTAVKGITSTAGKEVVNYAKQFLGGKYVYGGTSLTNGIDCSGFTQQIMKRFGVKIERNSRAQFAANGYQVSAKSIMPGDLVFYGANGRTIDHVAIYAGNGQIVHASDRKSGIKMSKLYYGKPIIGIKRVLS